MKFNIYTLMLQRYDELKEAIVFCIVFSKKREHPLMFSGDP